MSNKTRRIWVTDEITRELISEFKVTGAYVLQSLKFHSHTNTGKAIRMAALKKMTETEKENKKLMAK